MKTTNYLSIYKRMMSACFAIILLSGCDHENIEYTFSGSSDNPIGEQVAINISLQDFSEYNTTDKITAATRSDKPLISEYVKLKTFSLTRSPEEVENSKMIGLMELFADTVPPSPQTRSIMVYGNLFRLIMFRKVGTNYVFQTAADYTSNGTSTPVLNQGTMVAPLGSTYRIVGYSFNNNSPLGTLPDDYQWNSTSISIPDLSNDFLTFDSGDITISTSTYSLPVIFSHKLCKLTVTASLIGVTSSALNNYTGAYIKEGGKKSSWKIGSNDIAPNTEDGTPIASPPKSSSITFRLVPYSSTRPISVKFKSLIVGGFAIPESEIISQSSVQLVPGNSYTMKVRIRLPVREIHVPSSEIDQGATVCSASDKARLSKLIWAGSNLVSTDNNTQIHFGLDQTSQGCYYGGIYSSAEDPCTKLDKSLYGNGWRCPTYDELRSLSVCGMRVTMGSGMWFMNYPKGVFLHCSGSSMTPGSASPNHGYGSNGNYRSFGSPFSLQFKYTSVEMETSSYPAVSVRCVKDTK